MKQIVTTAFLATVALLGLTQDSEANGGLFRRSRGGCDTGCAPACAPDCATTAHVPAPIQYEDRKVIVHKQVWKEKEVEVVVSRRVTREEKYQYTVAVPVTTQEKRMVSVCTPVTKEVDYTYTVMVPKTMQKEVVHTSYQCVREMVTVQVPVCKTVCVTCVDECGRCYTRRDRVTVMEDVTRCVVKHIPITEKRIVNYTVCEAQVRQGKRTVCELVHSQKEVLVNVCSIQNQQREGVRTVCEYKNEKVKQMVKYCETIAEETIVRVAVGGASCDNACSDDCGRGHGRGHRTGLFRRGGGSCCN